MNYGLYLSANGVLSSLHRQDVLANNLANVETVGFKPDMVFDRMRRPERLESPSDADPRLMLERLGGGHFIAPTLVDLEQGSLNRTDNPLDLAIEGEGLFLVSTGVDAEPRLTRDGRFTIDGTSTLVTSIGGHAALDADGRPIRLTGSGPIDVDGDGTIRQNDRVIARLALVTASPDDLLKEGNNLFRLRGSSTAEAAAGTGRVYQGFVETSAVDPIMTLTDLVGATRSVEANSKLMQYHDSIMAQAINTFGRVS